MPKMNLKIEHQVPGRVRLKIPAGKGNAELLKQISEVFGVIPGIEEVTVNPRTGSVVLHYDTDATTNSTACSNSTMRRTPGRTAPPPALRTAPIPSSTS